MPPAQIILEYTLASTTKYFSISPPPPKKNKIEQNNLLLKNGSRPKCLKISLNSSLTLPVPGGPARRIARPAIFFDLISSTTTPHAYMVAKKLKMCFKEMAHRTSLHISVPVMYHKLNSLQVLENKAAKIILNQQLRYSSTKALEELKWTTLATRRHNHRCTFIYKCMNGLIDFDFELA